MNYIKSGVAIKTYLVSGVAGFIGMHFAKRLLDLGHQVVGLDNINNYYDVELKNKRLAQLESYPVFSFKKVDLTQYDQLKDVFLDFKFDAIIHLAAQAGVRYSLEKPQLYIQSNIVGFQNFIQLASNYKIEHFVFASSSSVYGNNASGPFSEDHCTSKPVSLYAASKKTNELIASVYSQTHNLKTTGLRYFTVYGPWGRPDMSPWLFSNAILAKKQIDIFNNGNMLRDFTYIDDIVEGTLLALNRKKGNISEVYNIGGNSPVELMSYITLLEDAFSIKAVKKFLPMQPGDVKTTYASINKIKEHLDFVPNTKLEEGIKHWAKWFNAYFYEHIKNRKI